MPYGDRTGRLVRSGTQSQPVQLGRIMDEKQFLALCKNGQFKEALALANEGREDQKFTPSRFSMDKKTKKPIFYRGNKRVEVDENGEWQISKNTHD